MFSRLQHVRVTKGSHCNLGRAQHGGEALRVSGEHSPAVSLQSLTTAQPTEVASLVDPLGSWLAPPLSFTACCPPLLPAQSPSVHMAP